MTQASDFLSSLIDPLLASGNKILAISEQASQIHLNASKEILDSQLELGSALADLGAAQLKGLSEPGAVGDLLQRQKDGMEALATKLQGSFEQLRSIATEAQQAYTKLGQDAAADFAGVFGKKAA